MTENNSLRSLLIDSATRIFLDYSTREQLEKAESGNWPAALWSALESAGLAAAAVSEERGGVDVDLGDVAALIRTAGRMAAPVPLVETLLAEYVLASARLPSVTGPSTIGPVLNSDSLTLTHSSSGWHLNGVLRSIPWARDAQSLVVLAKYQDRYATVLIRETSALEIYPGWNLAREPRDIVSFNDLGVPNDDVTLTGGLDPDALIRRGAFYRSMQMAGSLDAILEMTLRYAGERIQFGRPISKFQAIQQQVAVLASHVGACSAAVNGALEALRRADTLERSAIFAIGAAKSRVSEAAGICAAIAHQVHGAMGFTHEHGLHRNTRRLWSWREEFGNETEWSARVGQVAVSVGGEQLWSLISTPQIMNSWINSQYEQ